MQNRELIDKTSPIPAYHQIMNDMMERVNSNEWELHSKLPSEPALAQEYGVSRVTMRQAMAELEKRSIIARYQGKGAFLVGKAKPFMENLNLPTVNSFRDANSRTVNSVIELRVDAIPPAYVTEAFNETAEHGDFVYLCRVFSKKNQPIGLNHAWFPAERVPMLVEQGLIKTSISTTLKERYGYDIIKVDNIIEATKAHSVDTTLLRVPYDTSLLRIQSTHFISEEVPLFISNTLWVGDLTRFHFSTSK